MNKWAIGVVTTAVLSLPLIFDYKALEILRLKVFDALVQEHTPSGHFVVLDITEEDIQQEGGWPFPRQRLAEIQTELIDRGAIGVGWVIMFPQPDRMGGDVLFATSLQQGTNVLAVPEYENRIFPSTDGTVVLGDNPVDMIELQGYLPNISLLETATYQGIVSAPTDVDNLVRRIPLIVHTPDGWVASFATQVLKVLTGEGTYQIKTYESGIQAIRIPELGVIPTDKYGRKWVSWIDTPKTTLDEMHVAGKFVFVGVTAAGVMPQIATPHGLLNPHHIQAALAESLLIPNSPQIPADRLVYELLIFLVLCTLALLLGRKCTPVYMAAGAGGILFSTIMLEWYFVTQKALLIDTTYSGISLVLILGQQFWLNFREQSLLRQQIKKQFEHYMDPRQVKRLQDDPSILKLGGEKKEATFLFTDVRGFTSMSESLKPEQVTYVMNKALTAQQKAVQKHGGMVDKYIGDAMMAIFNAPLDIPSHAKAACDCAHDIVKNMKELNSELQAEGLPPIAIGIGVNTGEAVIGNMGSESRFDYTAIGDAVNCGARLESATKEAGKDILIGERTESLCGYYLQELDPMPVKGKAKPLRVFTFME